jgi:hypothetical protein
LSYRATIDNAAAIWIFELRVVSDKRLSVTSGNASRVLNAAVGALLLVIIAGGAAAHAATYCWFSGQSLLANGGTTTQSVKVVVASVPRADIPGRSSNRPWCVQHRSSLGGHSSNRIVEKPRLGSVRADGYRISYRGDKVGHDRFVIERTWLNGLNNQWQKGTLIYEVDVVPQAF